jgi:selenocysteine lyase/cysteine desulfurase
VDAAEPVRPPPSPRTCGCVQYGAVPKVVAASHHALSERCERNPDRWIGEYRPIVAEARGLVADLIKARSEDVVMVENASTGVNTVLRHLEPPLKRGDKVLYLSCAYGMTQSVLRFLHSSVGIELVMVSTTTILRALAGTSWAPTLLVTLSAATRLI